MQYLSDGALSYVDRILKGEKSADDGTLLAARAAL